MDDSRFFIVPERTGWKQKRYGLATRKGGVSANGASHFEEEDTEFEV